MQVSQLCRALGDVGVRVETDLGDHHSPGWKYNFWELKARTLPAAAASGASSRGQHRIHSSATLVPTLLPVARCRVPAQPSHWHPLTAAARVFLVPSC